MLSYERDRRNVYGEAPHRRERISLFGRHCETVRTGIMKINKSATRGQHRTPILPMNLSRRYIVACHRSGKNPDAPLGEVIANKSRKRTIMRKHGGRKALVTRTPLKSEE